MTKFSEKKYPKGYGKKRQGGKIFIYICPPVEWTILKRQSGQQTFFRSSVDTSVISHWSWGTVCFRLHQFPSSAPQKQDALGPSPWWVRSCYLCVFTAHDCPHSRKTNLLSNKTLHFFLYSNSLCLYVCVQYLSDQKRVLSSLGLQLQKASGARRGTQVAWKSSQPSWSPSHLLNPLSPLPS